MLAKFTLTNFNTFDVLKSELEKIKPMIKHEMERNAFKMDVPLDVEIGVGENWLEAH
jgi:DNA polymerase-1